MQLLSHEEVDCHAEYKRQYNADQDAGRIYLTAEHDIIHFNLAHDVVMQCLSHRYADKRPNESKHIILFIDIALDFFLSESNNLQRSNFSLSFTDIDICEVAKNYTCQ